MRLCRPVIGAMVSCALPVLFLAGASVLLLTTTAQMRAIALLDAHTVPHLGDSPLSMMGHLSALARPAERRRPLLVLQHGAGTGSRDKAKASRAMMELYANAWGYDHRVDATEYVDDTAEVNRLIALKFALGAELLADNGVEWIFMTDSDAIVTDPTVPLHAMTPPPSMQPEPYFLVAQSADGMLIHSLLIRVTTHTYHFVDRLIDERRDASRNRDRRSAQRPRGRPVAGSSLADWLCTDRPMSKHVYEVPGSWYSAEASAGGHNDPDPKEATWTPQVLVHVRGEDGFLEYVEAAARAVREMLQSGQRSVQGGARLQMVEQAARKWWEQPRGIDHTLPA